MRAILLNDEVLSKRMHEFEIGTNKIFRLVFERLDAVDEEILDLKKDKPMLPAKRKKIGLR
jgi:hypothetical protein